MDHSHHNHMSHGNMAVNAHSMMNHSTSSGSSHSMHGMNMTGHKGDMHKSHDMHMGHMMKMYFHGGVTETILFECWKTTSFGTMAASFIGIFIMAFLYEGLKFFREHLSRKYYSSVNFSSVAVTSSSGAASGEIQKVVTNRVFSVPHFVQTLLHVVQLVISYFLMLIFMTYNVWLCLAVALGAGFGYFAFGWKRAVVVNVSEHCH